MTEDRYTVYIHIFPNDKVYVGITSQNCEQRWKNGNGYANNSHLKNAIKKYGWKNIQHVVIRDDMTKEDACQIEKDLIALYDSTNRIKGYNKSIGGELSSLGFHHTEEAKKRIGKASIGRKRTKEAIEIVAKAKRKQVDVYDLQGKLIARCKSLTEAEKLTGVDNSNISSTCKGKYKQFKGYIFKYAGEKPDIEKSKYRKPVMMFDLNGEYIKTFSTVKEAIEETHLTHIGDCCKGKYSHCGGYIWRYA